MRALVTLVVLIALAAGGAWWFFGKNREEIPQPPPVQESVPAEQAESNENSPDGGRQEPKEQGEERKQVVSPVSRPEEPVAEPPGYEKVLTTEEDKFVTGIGDWFTEMSILMGNFDAAYKLLLQGEAEQAASIGIRAQYDKVHDLTQALSVPEEHVSALSAARAMDGALGEALSGLSDPPTVGELEALMALSSTFTDELNTVSRARNAVRY